jgi:hypothetical protein
MVVVIHCAENNSAKTVSFTPNTTIEEVYQQCLKRFPLSSFERAYGIFTCSQSKRDAAGIQPLALVKLLPHFMRISELSKQPVSYTLFFSLSYSFSYSCPLFLLLFLQLTLVIYIYLSVSLFQIHLAFAKKSPGVHAAPVFGVDPSKLEQVVDGDYRVPKGSFSFSFPLFLFLSSLPLFLSSFSSFFPYVLFLLPKSW